MYSPATGAVAWSCAGDSRVRMDKAVRRGAGLLDRLVRGMLTRVAIMIHLTDDLSFLYVRGLKNL